MAQDDVEKLAYHLYYSDKHKQIFDKALLDLNEFDDTKPELSKDNLIKLLDEYQELIDKTSGLGGNNEQDPCLQFGYANGGDYCKYYAYGEYKYKAGSVQTWIIKIVEVNNKDDVTDQKIYNTRRDYSTAVEDIKGWNKSNSVEDIKNIITEQFCIDSYKTTNAYEVLCAPTFEWPQFDNLLVS